VSQPGIAPDKRFVYYLLGSTGVCVVPISSFCTQERGFRTTLLERNEKEFTRIFHTMAENITAYLNS
jgi:aspartate/methionine/tyrosine aminotransferase